MPVLDAHAKEPLGATVFIMDELIIATKVVLIAYLLYLVGRGHDG
jgi:hypothetical protein